MFDSRTRMKNVTDASMMAIAQLVTVSNDRGTRISLSPFRSQDRSTIYSTGATGLRSEAAEACETRLFERPDSFSSLYVSFVGFRIASLNVPSSSTHCHRYIISKKHHGLRQKTANGSLTVESRDQ